MTAGAISPQLIEVQAEYHRKSLALLQNVLPQIKAQQGKCPWALSCMRHEAKGSVSRWSRVGLHRGDERLRCYPVAWCWVCS